MKQNYLLAELIESEEWYLTTQALLEIATTESIDHVKSDCHTKWLGSHRPMELYTFRNNKAVRGRWAGIDQHSNHDWDRRNMSIQVYDFMHPVGIWLL